MKPIETRLDELETFVADLPGLISQRFDSVAAQFQESSGRLSLLDRQIAIHVRDVRELRSVITRQVLNDDKLVTAIKSDVEAMKSDVTFMKDEVTGLKSGLAELLIRLPKS